MRRVRTGGGWPALFYTLRKAREVGGIWKLWKAMRSKNACKTCALGMGGQGGGMVNERGAFPEVCKKSLQAMAADMQGAIRSDFWSTYSIAQLQAFTPRELESCGRLVEPVLYEHGSQYYRPISWDEAFERILGRLKTLSADETFWYFSGRSSNEAGFLLQMFARIYGTNNVNNCSFYCHQASGVGLNSVLGTGTATLLLEDVEHADLVFIIGGNPASNHPRLMSTLKHIRRRGGEVIVINPLVETGLVNFSVPSDPISLLFGTKIATQYVQPHIGGDLALLTGIAKRVLELNAHDETFLVQHCDHWPEWKVRLQSVSWDEIYDKSGVGHDEIEAMARSYARAKNVVFTWTMGITHHTHGVQNVEAIANLALLRGMVGRPNAGLLPIRGHSNVQGIGSVGVTPKLKDAIFDRLQSHFGVTLPTTVGLDTLACMEAADRQDLKFGFCLGGNLYGSNPDSAFAKQSLSRLETLVSLNTTLNTGHAWGLAKETIILPVLARDEEPQPTTQESMFNYIRMSDGGPARLQGPKSEVEIIARIARGTLGDNGPVDWQAMQNTSRIREAIAKIVPGFDKIADIDRTKKEFQLDGRTFHTPRFPTANGKAQLQVHDLPVLVGAPEELRLMTIRSEGQFNTVVYEDYDLYRGIDRRDVILIHPNDLQRLGLTDRQRVTITSDTGRMDGIVAVAFEQIRAGNVAMYYPESNVLVPRSSDPRSRTPAFKLIPVRVAASAAVAARPLPVLSR
ncbi:FdhF/YdeP family oxidoreductase [Planctellipticum variicoloris]|uniref:FdhF/YdeP family oxidoreductase n=1 Tax=Planctellipticum variicoloris TaxID=3064265 RepID=UPI003013D132|nr:FdhF/YdeP family oxidoreductase [Planctomycetaceae bacterium SH412]